MTDDELEELRQQTRGTDRIDATGDEDAGVDVEADSGSGDDAASDTGSSSSRTASDAKSPTPADDFDECLASTVGSVERGVQPKSFSASDPVLSAFFQTVYRDDEAREDVGEALVDHVDVDVEDGYTKSELVRLSVLAGVQEAAPEYYEELVETF